MMKLILAIVATAILSVSAHAWEPTEFYKIDKSVQYPAVRVKAWKRLPRPIPKADPVVRHVPTEETLCKPIIRVVGDQGLSLDKAEGEAKKNFTAMTRWRYGERYSSFENARDTIMECNQSSIPVTGGVVGSVLPKEYRCEIIAMPCRSKPEDGK